MITTLIEGGGCFVSIEVEGYEREFAEDFSDANWLKCRIKVSVGGFRSDIDATMTTHDFMEFQNGLSKSMKNLSGAATFRTDEEWLSIDIEMNARGAAHVRGAAQVHGLPIAILTFEFETDQSYLSQTCAQLGKVVQSFPIRGQADA
jgi:hypothetical protein